MTSLLPSSHDGHASIELLSGFQEAQDNYKNWRTTTPEPELIIYGKQSASEAIFIACSDALTAIVPYAIRPQLRKPITTYSEAEFLLRQALQLRLNQ